MRIKDELFFSPKHRFSELDFEDPSGIVEAFRDRVRGFYLDPASRLADSDAAFALGSLCCVTIDFLAKYSLGVDKATKQTFVRWLSRIAPQFQERDPRNDKQPLAMRFYNDFRCGLVHQGRVLNLGQFSFEPKEVVISDQTGIIVNPRLLLDGIDNAFEGYVINLESNSSARGRLIKQLRKDFDQELEMFHT